MRNYAGNMQGHQRAAAIQCITCSYIFFHKKSSVFCCALFKRGNEVFPKDSSSNESVPLLVILHLPYSKYRGVKICF